MGTLVEICVDSVDGARRADVAGAARVEVCAGLADGGTTPSIGTVTTVLATVTATAVQVLIRPRAGDFRYSADELDVMLADIAAIRTVAAGPRVGFALGALDAGSEIDLPMTRRLVDACGDAPVTFHKAFDATPDLARSLDALAALGVHRVLTAGGAARALDGVPVLARLVRQAGTRIGVIAAGSVRPHNVLEIVARTCVPEVHLRATGAGQETSAEVIRDVLAAVARVDRGHAAGA